MENLFLQNTLLFRDMTPEEIDQAAQALRVHVKRYPKDAVLLRAGNATAWMGMVLRGGVTIESNDLWGNRVLLSHVGEGQYFAETYAFLEGETLPVDVVADQDSTVAFFHLEALREKGSLGKHWAAKMIKHLLIISAHKNLALSARSFHTASHHIRGRIMAYLNTLSLQNHGCAFDLPFDRQQLADYLNVERTALSKELGRMRREGLIDFHRNHFVLLREEP